MPNKLLPIFFLFFLSIPRVTAQASTISVGPLLTCSLITFACPNVSGCCTIAGCCGGGCCENGYTCINEGSSDEACCPASDPTKCGTVIAPSGSGSGSGSGGNTCTAIDNCPRDPDVGLAWTCLLGMKCGFSYRECNPCPNIGSGSGSSGGGSGDDSSGDGSSSASSSSSPPASGPTSESSPTSSSGSSTSAGYHSREIRPIMHWLAAVGLGGMLAITI